MTTLSVSSCQYYSLYSIMEREFQRDLHSITPPLEVDPAKQQIYPKYYKGQFEYIIEGEVKEKQFPNIHPRYGAFILVNSPLTVADSQTSNGIVQYLRHRYWLTTVRIHSCMLHQSYLFRIDKAKYIRELDLMSNYVGNKGIEYIGKMGSLKVLNLADNPISDEGAEGLSKMQGLRELDLRHTNITYKGIKKIRKIEHLMVLIIMYMRKIKQQEMPLIYKQFQDTFVIA